MRREKLKKYLMYAVGEIALVVVGILIALSINNWNADRQARKVEKVILKEIRSDLNRDREELTSALQSVEDRINKITTLRSVLNTGAPYHDSLATCFGAVYGMHIVVPNTAAYETLASGGLERVSDDRLRFAIVDLFDQHYKRLESINDIETTVNLDVFRPYFYRHFTDIDIRQEATPLDYAFVVQDAEFMNLLDYRLHLLERNQKLLYQEAVFKIDSLLALVTSEVGLE